VQVVVAHLVLLAAQLVLGEAASQLDGEVLGGLVHLLDVEVLAAGSPLLAAGAGAALTLRLIDARRAARTTGSATPSHPAIARPLPLRADRTVDHMVDARPTHGPPT